MDEFEKDRTIDGLRAQVSELFTKNSAMMQAIALLEDENYNLLKEVYRLLKQIDENFKGFKKDFDEKSDD